MAGISATQLVYPTELTDADWQKKKGRLGKLTSTGLGAVLKSAEAAWKKVDVNQLNPAMTPSKTREQLAEKVKACKTYYASKVVPISKEMDNIVKAAKDAQAKLNKAVTGKSAAKAAAAVQKAAETFRVSLKSVDLQAAIDKVLADIKRKEDLAAKNLAPMLKQFAASSKVFLSKPSKASWGDNIKQQGRSVSNQIAQLPAYRDEFWKDWVKLKGFDLGTIGIDSDEPADVAKMVKLVKIAQQQVGKIAAFKPK